VKRASGFRIDDVGNSLRTLAVFAAMAFIVGAAQASPTTWNFTGVVEYDVNGDSPGRTVSGWLTIDIQTLYDQSTNGTTQNRSSGLFFGTASQANVFPKAAQSIPPQVSGQYSGGLSQFSIGGADNYDFGYISLTRNDSETNSIFISGKSVDNNGHERYISLHVLDFLGTTSQIFDDPNGGLNLTQNIDWVAPGAASQFYGYEYDTVNRTYSAYQGGLLTSVSVSSAPEPATLALVALGLTVAVRRSHRIRICGSRHLRRSQQRSPQQSG
jgi:hypothetical protein